MIARPPDDQLTITCEATPKALRALYALFYTVQEFFLQQP